SFAHAYGVNRSAGLGSRRLFLGRLFIFTVLLGGSFAISTQAIDKTVRAQSFAALVTLEEAALAVVAVAAAGAVMAAVAAQRAAAFAAVPAAVKTDHRTA